LTLAIVTIALVVAPTSAKAGWMDDLRVYFFGNKASCIKPEEVIYQSWEQSTGLKLGTNPMGVLDIPAVELALNTAVENKKPPIGNIAPDEITYWLRLYYLCVEKNDGKLAPEAYELFLETRPDLASQVRSTPTIDLKAATAQDRSIAQKLTQDLANTYVVGKSRTATYYIEKDRGNNVTMREVSEEEFVNVSNIPAEFVPKPYAFASGETSIL